jgi:hypothetical protein
MYYIFRKIDISNLADSQMKKVDLQTTRVSKIDEVAVFLVAKDCLGCWE